MILRLATHAMGTRFELVLVGEEEDRLRAAGEEAIREIEECDARWSLFRRDSFLAHLHREAPRTWVRVGEDDYALLEACERVHRASGGAFDPTVAPLMEACGFRGAAGDRAAALARVGFETVRLDPARRAVHLDDPETRLDLGGVAKGHGLDLAARALREAGVTQALLHGGTSTVVAIGRPPDAAGWRVAVAGEAGAPVARLADRALAVSAPAGRVVEGAGGPIGHVLDPRSGAAVPGGAHAAVVAAGAALADAWSTALLVAGDELEAQPGIDMLYRPVAGDWRLTPAADAGPDPSPFEYQNEQESR